LDIGRWPKEAERFRVNCAATSRQLPTISAFRDGSEFRRRPIIGARQRAVPFVFTEVCDLLRFSANQVASLQENCIFEFDLNNLYAECKENLNRSERRELGSQNDEKKEQ
jgi:hypothetical protein